MPRSACIHQSTSERASECRLYTHRVDVDALLVHDTYDELKLLRGLDEECVSGAKCDRRVCKLQLRRAGPLPYPHLQSNRKLISSCNSHNHTRALAL